MKEGITIEDNEEQKNNNIDHHRAHSFYFNSILFLIQENNGYKNSTRKK